MPAAGEIVDDGVPEELSPGARVEHPEWGAGTVQSVDDGTLTVVFDTVGYKTLALEVVASRGLLQPM